MMGHSSMDPSAEAGIGAATRRHTILIVDDEPANVRALAEVLKDGNRILIALTGTDALGAVEAEAPDIILLDIMLPDLDGFSVCRRLKEQPQTRDIPIIFVTARIDMDTETRALAAGAVDFITKPLSPAVVRARVSVHLALKDRNDALMRLASLDGLTGLANRRAFDAALDTEWRRAWRTRSPLAVAMVDVDHFKQYNDHYGHQSGDDCLRAVAETLKAQVPRVTDVVARYGGEEFSLILPGCSTADMATLAERLRAAVADVAIPHAASPVAGTVTVSLGMACLGLTCGEKVYPQAAEAARNGGNHLVGLADRALYAAKAAGRNRAVCTEVALTEPSPMT